MNNQNINFIVNMKTASKILTNIFTDLHDYIIIADDITTNQIDMFCYQRMQKYNCQSAAYKYPGEICEFPKYTCISINNEVCHGIPSEYKLKKGDIISIDICIEYCGYYADSCVSFIFREALNDNDIKLLQAGYQTMKKTIDIAKPNMHTGNLGYMMQTTAKQMGFDVIRDFAGHFIGKKLHISPYIPFFGKQNTGKKLAINDCLTIEPMVIKGDYRLEIGKDGWTATSINGEKSCQFEHTILITENGHEILTLHSFESKFIW